MKYSFTYSERFKNSYNKLTEKEKKQTENKLKILSQNPLHPSLRVKKIQGSSSLFECSVNMDIRIIWYYESESIIFFLDIGHHDILKNY